MSELGITITKPGGYSSHQVAKAVGISYRQLDHWVRVGTIRLEHGCCPGSGQRRRWSQAEVDRLREMVVRYNDALAFIEAFRSGALWRELEAAA